MTEDQRDALTNFVQAAQDPTELPGTETDPYSLTQGQAEGQAQAKQEPASGEIFGILKGMKEGFEQRLADAQKDEMQSQADYEKLKAAKEEEITAGTAQIDTKTQELA